LAKAAAAAAAMRAKILALAAKNGSSCEKNDVRESAAAVRSPLALCVATTQRRATHARTQ
jgi:hypothetical protein